MRSHLYRFFCCCSQNNLPMVAADSKVHIKTNYNSNGALLHHLSTEGRVPRSKKYFPLPVVRGSELFQLPVLLCSSTVVPSGSLEKAASMRIWFGYSAKQFFGHNPHKIVYLQQLGLKCRGMALALELLRFPADGSMCSTSWQASLKQSYCRDGNTKFRECSCFQGARQWCRLQQFPR